MPLEYKSIPFEVKEVVDVSGGGWEVAGYASTFGGEPDSYGDIIAAGAFTESIATRPTKFLYEHFEPIGKQLEIREDEHGLFGRWSIVNTRTGEDAYKLAKAGVLDSLSIGYFTQDADYDKDGVRILRKIDLYEVSAVAIPANKSAVITDVKGFGLTLDQHIGELRDAALSIKSRLAAGMAKRVSEGQPIRDARKDLLVASSGTLRDLADQMDALLQPSPPPERINVGAELRRRRYLSAGLTERPA
jgi:hypothetical protein